ncbi:MAG: sodium:proton antiporter [Myxococcales bacterium]|nr:sodium:proton antiporter [Myxococcales bacterium]
MRKVGLYSALLIAGLAASQALPGLLGEGYGPVAHAIKLLTMVGLGFIMVHVGYEFDVDKTRLGSYGWDYLVAATAAAFPWIFCAIYFVYLLAPEGGVGAWKESLLAARFAAPTSAGVLFSMLAAAGLSATWMYRKARVLAIFDDLDTVLLMIPLKMLIVGVRWQLGVVVAIMAVLLWIAWRYLHALRIPMTWPWVLAYSVGIVAVSESIYFASKLMEEVAPIHIEVLLPAFVLGCIAVRYGHEHGHDEAQGVEDPHASPSERRATLIITAAFMVLVGLSMPALQGIAGSPETVALADEAAARAYLPDDPTDPIASTPPAAGLDWGWIAIHVLIITALSNLGKMFPLFCYRREAHWRERLAVAVAMFPRGEVGAGVLITSLGYGIGGPMIVVAMFSLALNLLLTGGFIIVVRRLLASVPAPEPALEGAR